MTIRIIVALILEYQEMVELYENAVKFKLIPEYNQDIEFMREYMQRYADLEECKLEGYPIKYVPYKGESHDN